MTEIAMFLFGVLVGVVGFFLYVVHMMRADLAYNDFISSMNPQQNIKRFIAVRNIEAAMDELYICLLHRHESGPKDDSSNQMHACDMKLLRDGIEGLRYLAPDVAPRFICD
jgi:hypothetical protein